MSFIQIYNKKIFFLLLITIIILFILVIWLYPVKKSLDDNISIIDYSNNNIAILCKAGGNTGPAWNIIEYVGIENISTKDIDIIGYTPDKILKNPLYMYMNSKFLFVGNFISENSEIFEVEQWYFVGDIKREHLILPYPSKKLNIFEIRL